MKAGRRAIVAVGSEPRAVAVLLLWRMLTFLDNILGGGMTLVLVGSVA